MKIFDELVLVEEYEKCRRCRIVAEKYGCSDETVRRALIKYNVPRVLRHPRPTTKKKATEEELQAIVDEYYANDMTINDLAAKHKRSAKTISGAIKRLGHGLKQNPYGRKITTEQLAIEAKTLNCGDIATKYGMSFERVYIRAKKAGIKVATIWGNDNWIRRASRYGVEEYDSTITLNECIKRFNGICQICGKPVDMFDIENGHIRRLYPTVDHIIPLSKGGSHTWQNIQLAHMSCNAGKCDKVAKC